jgi:hypothetical protein
VLTAIEHVGAVGVGATSPQYFRASDNKLYIVKLQSNKLGPKVLANEYLAVRLGQLIGLCFPPGGIIGIGEELLQKYPCLLAEGATSGRHFASQYLSDTEYLVKENIDKASNLTEMAGIILFDHLFHNADRCCNKKNLLLRRENQICKIYAIDNSHLFRVGKWTIKSLHKLSTSKKVYHHRHYGLLLKNCLYPHDFLPYLKKLNALSDELIENLVSEIPVEWLPDRAERAALTQHIRIRRNLAEELWHKLCKHIPQERGGCKYSDARVILMGSRSRALSRDHLT